MDNLAEKDMETMSDQVDKITTDLLNGIEVSDGGKVYDYDDVMGFMEQHNFTEWESAHSLAQIIWLVRTNDGRTL